MLNKLSKEEQSITSSKQAISVIFFGNGQLGCLRQTLINIAQIQSLIKDAQNQKSVDYHILEKIDKKAKSDAVKLILLEANLQDLRGMLSWKEKCVNWLYKAADYGCLMGHTIVLE